MKIETTWTYERIEQLKYLVLTKNNYEIAEIMGMNYYSILRKLVRMKIKNINRRVTDCMIKITPEMEEQIIKMAMQHISFAEISRACGISEYGVSKVCKKYNIISPKTNRTNIIKELEANKQSQCKKCNNIYTLLNVKNKTLCRPCFYEYSRGRYHAKPFDKKIHRKLQLAKIHSRKVSREFSIVTNDILELWELQKGLCFYTGVPMSQDTNTFETFSIDRKDPNVGYIKDNIVLCRWGINKMKQNLDNKTFIKMCKEIAHFQENNINDYQI